MKSAAFKWSKHDTAKVLTAFGFALASAIVAGLVAVFQNPDVSLPVWLVPLVPAINAFLYGVARWVSDNQK